MSFNGRERDILLKVRGVGPKVIERFEALGIDSLKKLAEQDADRLCIAIAAMLGSTCWKNSPQARSAVAAALKVARTRQRR